MPAPFPLRQQRLPGALRAIQPVTVRPDECALAVGVAQGRHYLTGLCVQLTEVVADLLQCRRRQTAHLRQRLEV